MDKLKNQKINYTTPSFICLSCGQKIPWERTRKLYCSDLCKQEASFIRYVRSCKRNGRINRPDIQEAIEIRLVHIVSGGYQSTERKISKSLREAVILRDNGFCKICGKIGIDIDYINGDSNDMSNLQFLCRECHNEKTKSRFVKVTPDDPRYYEIQSKKKALYLRIHSKKPLHVCDDDLNWKTIFSQTEIERKKIFYDTIRPIAVKLRKLGLINRKITEQFNIQNIPTFNGYGKWYAEYVNYIFHS